MGEERMARLAVARLDELEPAQPLRFREAMPMHGFCLISGDAGRCRVTLYIENGRPLTDRTGHDGFYYEGWLVGPGGPVSLGAFNVGPGGQGSATRVLETSPSKLSESQLVRVTAEPFGGSASGGVAVLEGRLVWLETASAEVPPTGRTVDSPPPAERGEAAEAEASPEQAGEAPALEPVGVTVEPAGKAVETVSAATETPAPAAGCAADEAAGQAMPEAPRSEPTEPVQTAPESAEGGPAAPSEMAAPEPAAEARAVVADPPAAEVPPPQASVPAAPAPPKANPLEQIVQLVQRHPMAPRATGTAVVNIRQGRLTLMLRGLPSPTALGRDRTTDRPFNAYRVWLVNQQTHTRTPAGFCQRAWGENFRFNSEGLPLNRHDTILVTAEDRTASGTNHASPQVVIGSYMP